METKELKQPCWVNAPSTSEEQDRLISIFAKFGIDKEGYSLIMNHDGVYILDEDKIKASITATDNGILIIKAIKNTYPKMEIPKEERKFTVFEEVLVRDNNEAEWLPKHFSRMGRPKDYYKYIVTSGTGYNHCIPFNGNEHLLYTNNNPE